MGDPICKWRNASVWTAVELVSQLPKHAMPNNEFRHLMDSSIYGKAFNKTAYQTACQMGLYYIDENKMYRPRFDHNISNDEALAYMKRWVREYYVPNPYTARKFSGMTQSYRLVAAIATFVKDNPTITNLETVCNTIFGEETGNLLCVRYIINEFSDIMEVDSDMNITLLHPVTEDLVVWNKRFDKKAFFETFNF